jgi:hypothetical protein
MNKVVEIAMQSFTRIVTEHGSVLRPLDKATAIDMFETLHSGGEEYEPKEIIAWLENERGWPDLHAQSVGEIAQKVLDGKKQPCIRHIYGNVGLAHWRKQAAAE